MSTTPDINRYLRENPRDGKYGAPLGRTNRDDSPRDPRRYCQRVRFTDGDYSADGTYWGGGRGTLPLWAVFTADFATLCFYRAATRADAMREYWTGYNNGTR